MKQTIKARLFHGGRRPTRIRFGPGRDVLLMLDRRNDLQREFGLHEVELHRIYRSAIHAGSTVYDVGAADGDTTMIFAKLARHGHVVAFEPVTAACQLLVLNLDLNPLLKKRVTLIQAYIGARPGNGRLGDETTPSLTLDTLVDRGEIPPPDFIKIDVDGAEMDVLSGMTGLLRASRPILLVETHAVALERACQIFLRDQGFDTKVIKNAWWRALYPELRPIGQNRWLVASPTSSARR